MKNLIYCHNEEDLELIAGATETVRKFDVVPTVGSGIMAVGPKHTWKYWTVVRRIFNHKGSGTIDLILREVNYENLYCTTAEALLVEDIDRVWAGLTLALTKDRKKKGGWTIKDIPQIVKNHCEDHMDEQNIKMLTINILAALKQPT